MQLADYRRPLSVYKLFPGQSEERALDVINEPAIDIAKMSATATICTPAVDRDGEVILPDGIDYDSRYRANPIVLWEHGFDPLLPTPIAKCEHPDGKLALIQSASELIGTSYFTNKVKESEQIFALIVEKIVRATSVRVDPTPGTERVETREGKRVLVMPKSTLIEWSWGCMGVNPETVRKCLDQGRLAGSAICDPILKTLRPFAAVRKGIGIGWSPEEPDVSVNTKTKAIDDPTQPDPALKTPTDPPPGDTATIPLPVDTPVEGDVETEDDDLPPSGQVLAAVHSSLTGLIANIEGAANRYENPQAKEYLAGLVEQLGTLANEVEGMFSTVAEGKSLTKTDGGEEPPPEDEVMKSWLAAGKHRDLQLGGFGAQLASLTKAKNLLSPQRRVLENVCKHLRKVVADARQSGHAAQQQATTDAEAKLATALGQTVEVFKTIGKELSDLIPKK